MICRSRRSDQSEHGIRAPALKRSTQPLFRYSNPSSPLSQISQDMVYMRGRKTRIQTTSGSNDDIVMMDSIIVRRQNIGHGTFPTSQLPELLTPTDIEANQHSYQGEYQSHPHQTLESSSYFTMPSTPMPSQISLMGIQYSYCCRERSHRPRSSKSSRYSQC